MIQTSRRSLITGLVSFLVAPAVVRAASLMPVKALPLEIEWGRRSFDSVYPILTDTVRRAFVPRLFVQLMHPHPFYVTGYDILDK